MAPKKKSPRPKKSIPEPTTVESGVVVPEPSVKKLELPFNVEQLNRLNGVPLPPPVIKPGEKGFGLGSELTRPLHGSALLEELSRMRQERFLTDMEIACKTKAFDVHKLVISSVSQYLRLANVITFAYLGRVHMSLYTIGCTVSAASTLQIPHLLQMCMDFLMAELNVHTCVYVWNIGAAYGLMPVREAARRYILENFAQFSETTQFNQLTLEQITSFLQDDNLALPSEVTTFQIAMRWLDFDPKRQEHAADLLSHVRFETIPANDLLPAKSFNQCVAVMDGFLYVAGGEDQNDARNQAKHAVGTLSSLVATGGRLYAIGGRNTEGLLATIESYQPSTNTWQLRTPMDMPRCCHASAVLPSGDILVTGGYVNCAYSRSVICYSIDSDTWSEQGELETPRGWHCSATVVDKVYVVGGSQLGPGGVRIDVMTMEVFNPESKEWTRAATLPLGVSTAGMSPLGDHLYLLGGWNEAEKRYKSVVQRYDPGTDSWSTVEDLPEPIVGVSCCALPLPPRHTSRRHRNTPSNEDQSSVTQHNSA
ncbi:hypothetical protein cypCar_00004248 [Cyprinus carpio]|nr:hypothetical protein cypCar_00004248 [Cyprinus carpio]